MGADIVRIGERFGVYVSGEGIVYHAATVGACVAYCLARSVVAHLTGV